ncbi:MAG: siderophore-interacting protein [Symploca sp. SIO2G7]|nr:siderophore-interacting protein [Symploca sp. SIO2G7]
MPGTRYRTLVVKKSVKVTPHMQRVIFTGDDLADFPKNYESGYVKLFFSQDGGAISDRYQLDGSQYSRRIYTVRSFSRRDNELAIEFSLYRRKGGLASQWAEVTKPGDKVLMDGPKLIKRVDNNSDWFLLAADMSGLPALCCNLESLPSQAQGYVVIEVVSDLDKQVLKTPDGMAISWIVNDNPGKNSDALLTGIKSLSWKHGNPYVWIAGESNSIRKIRHYIGSRNVSKENMYIASYWKLGYVKENHGIGKQISSLCKMLANFVRA